MRAVVRLVFLTAIRDRVFSGLAGLLALAFAVSLFLGDAAVLEQSETGRVYAAGAFRLVIVIGFALFLALQTQRLYESREIEAILSRSISRGGFVLAYWLGFSFSSFALIAPVSGLLLVFYGFSLDTLLWCASLALECFVVLAFAQFAALTFERATTTFFVTLAFYGFARLIGFFLSIRDATPAAGANKVVNPMIDILGLLIPRIDLMTNTNWLVYGFDAAAAVPVVLVQGLVFIGLALAASAFDLRNKQF